MAPYTGTIFKDFAYVATSLAKKVEYIAAVHVE